MKTAFYPVVGLFIVSLAGCATSSAGGDATAAAACETTAALDFEKAIATAQQTYPDAHPVEVEHDANEGRAAIEVELVKGGALFEVYLDAETGEELVKKEEELTDEEKTALAQLVTELDKGAYTLAQAVAFAREKYPEDEIREVEVEMRGDRLVFQVELRRAGEDTEFFHDPATGEVVHEEIRNPDDE